MTRGRKLDQATTEQAAEAWETFHGPGDAPATAHREFGDWMMRSPEHIEAYLPVTGDDHTSVVMEYSGRNSDGSTEQTRVAKLPDDMLARCLYDTYSRFATDSPQLSDLAFNRKVIDLMDKAKTFARIRR